ncbi:MAG: hypothetical protein U9P79_00565 [Candidatus Cloacimonadota bacterium]|nr:hypothetical protein [Candidatus Cloacimonadota bacterium]
MYNLQEKFKYATSENLNLQIDTEDFGMSIAGNDKAESELEIKIGSEKKIDLDDILNVKFVERKNKLTIKLNNPKNNKCKTDIRLSVPRKTNLKINSENAEFRISDLNGYVNTSFENGKLSMNQIVGRIECKTENGGISIEDSEGSMKLQTENGGIKLRQNKGKVIIRGENGGVKCSKCVGTLETHIENGSVKVIESQFENADIQNENGSIYFEFNDVEKGEFKFKNENGKIHLAIPEEIPFNIIAKNEIGNFHIGLDGDYDRRKENGKQILEMVKGSGNVKIIAENENGRITLVNSKTSKNPFSRERFNFEKLADSFEHIIDKIPSPEQQEKIHKKMEKAMKKLKKLKINIPDISGIVEDVTDNIENDVDFDIDGKNIGKKIKIEIKKSLKKATEQARKFKNEKTKMKNEETKVHEEREKSEAEKTELNTEEAEMVKQRSRLKILQLLEQGKINSTEAEKLLKAMEDRNE